MNPTKILLTLLISLLPLLVSADELNGKSLICERADDDVVIGFRFVQGRAETDWLTHIELVKTQDGGWELIEGDYVIGWEPIAGDYFIRRCEIEREDTSYVVDRTEIRWGENILNRQTLEMLESKESSKRWQCEVFSNDDDYWKQLENIRTQKQLEADMKQNKI